MSLPVVVSTQAQQNATPSQIVRGKTLRQALAKPPSVPECMRLVNLFLAGRNPRTLAAYQADLEDFRRYRRAPTLANAAHWLLEDPPIVANEFARIYQSKMIERGLQAATVNRRLATLRSLVKFANTLGLVSWTLSVENVPVPPYRRTGGPDRDEFRAMLEAARAQPGPKGLRDAALLRLLHDLGLRCGEAVRLDIEDVDLPGNRIFILGKARAQQEPVTLPVPTKAALAAWLDVRGPEPGPLFEPLRVSRRPFCLSPTRRYG
jgi:integrase/recombinase XerC